MSGGNNMESLLLGGGDDSSSGVSRTTEVAVGAGPGLRERRRQLLPLQPRRSQPAAQRNSGSSGSSAAAIELSDGYD
jgi:hypothetical protein